jgi:hypothetical protein
VEVYNEPPIFEKSINNLKVSQDYQGSFIVATPVDPEGSSVTLTARQGGKYTMPEFVLFDASKREFMISTNMKTQPGTYELLLQATDVFGKSSI